MADNQPISFQVIDLCERKMSIVKLYDETCKVVNVDGSICNKRSQLKGCEHDNCKYEDMCPEHAKVHLEATCYECGGEGGRLYCKGLEDCGHGPSTKVCFKCKENVVCVNCNYGDEETWLCDVCDRSKRTKRDDEEVTDSEAPKPKSPEVPKTETAAATIAPVCSVHTCSVPGCGNVSTPGVGCCYRDPQGNRCPFWNMCEDCSDEYIYRDCELCGSTVDKENAPGYCEMPDVITHNEDRKKLVRANHGTCMGSCLVCGSDICLVCNACKNGSDFLCESCAEETDKDDDDYNKQSKIADE